MAPTITEQSNTANTSGSVQGSAEESQEDREEINEETVILSTFDWESAFAELERRRRKEAKESGHEYVPSLPPKAIISSITNLGLVTIKFS